MYIIFFYTKKGNKKNLKILQEKLKQGSSGSFRDTLKKYPEPDTGTKCF